ncbi:MAG: type II secretion system GspH family protein [Candidatus Obscuribacterales bacterium]|nr:type II secretion system GspH family protein [Candidatus Obscuribacterales bacterium]
MNRNAIKRSNSAACFDSGTKHETVRLQRGIALVEMLVSIVVLSFLMIGIMDALSLTRRSATAVQNQIVAANIAQEMMDVIRNQNWNTIVAAAGTVTLSGENINRTAGSTSGLTYMPRPLVQDQVANNYSNGSRQNLFRGSVTQTISQPQGTTPNQTINVVITVSWPGENGGGRKSLTQSTMISEAGIHN